MNLFELKAFSQNLARALDGRVRFNRPGFMLDPFSPMKIEGVAYGIKVTIFLGIDGGLTILDHFQAPCPFEIYLLKPEPLLSTVEITPAVASPFPVYASPAHHDLNCIRRIFSNWENWRSTLDLFKNLDKPLMIASEQCQFYFPSLFIPTLGASIQSLSVHLSAAPFKTLAGSRLKSRYSDKPYVKLDDAEVPLSLRPLVPLAARWGLADEEEVMAFAKKVGRPAVKEFTSAFRARLDEIELFCNERVGDQPFSDVVVTFQLAFHAFALLESSSGE
jgi:hypothetical protein